MVPNGTVNQSFLIKKRFAWRIDWVRFLLVNCGFSEVGRRVRVAFIESDDNRGLATFIPFSSIQIVIYSNAILLLLFLIQCFGF